MEPRLSGIAARRFFTEANPPARKTFGFTLILREGTAPTTAFGVLGFYSFTPVTPGEIKYERRT